MPIEQAQLRFYGSYDPEFLFRKVELLHAAYSHRPEFWRFVQDIGATLEGTEDAYFLGLASEIHCSVFQQFESLFALLLAVFQGLPHWVFLSRYTTQELQEKTQALVDGDFAKITAGECSSAPEFVARAVYSGVAEVRTMDRWKRSLDDLGWFLSEMAEQHLVGRGEYNAYKHALRVLPGDGTKLLINTGGAGKENFQPIISMGYSLSSLEIENRTEGYVAREVTREFDPEYSYQALVIMSEIAKLTCEIRLGALRHKPVEIPTFEIDRDYLLRLKPIAKFAFPF